jgi:peptidoglycan/LPS O-acetylase OafA/YrhL
MQIEIVWPYFVLVTAVLALIGLPVFRFVDAAPQVVTRHASIDGLRGFLAFGVFVFHLIITHRYLLSAEWRPPELAFYALLGPVGVSLFFMVTGFLFFEKLLRARGRVRWLPLYAGRVFRIAPLYLFAVLTMLLVVFVKTDFTLHEPAGTVIASVLQWLALGIVNLQPDVNGYPATHVLAGVTWTISYEWAFYASLLLTAYCARGGSHRVLLPIALVSCLLGKTLLHSDVLGFAALFLCGMTVASLIHTHAARLSDRTASVLAIGCLLLIFFAAPLGVPISGYGTVVALLLATFFYLLCSGATLFGLLTTRAAQRLGHVSYSIYLLQGLALTAVFAITPLRQFALASPLGYWSAGLLCAAVLVAGATATYYLIELPGIRMGRQIFSRPTPTLPAASATVSAHSVLAHAGEPEAGSPA